jgi:hypothetical protein
MGKDFSKSRSKVFFGFATWLIVILNLTGCYKRSGEAVVLEKEHIAIREATPTPAAESSATPSESPASADAPGEEMVFEMKEDEINVDGYVMKKNVRGTSKDPRARDHERWIVRVEMVADLRRIDVHTDQSHWDKVKAGDRIKISYRQGKYTGTIWDSEIE